MRNTRKLQFIILNLMRVLLRKKYKYNNSFNFRFLNFISHSYKANLNIFSFNLSLSNMSMFMHFLVKLFNYIDKTILLSNLKIIQLI